MSKQQPVQQHSSSISDDPSHRRMLDPVLTRNVVKRLRPHHEHVKAIIAGTVAISGSKFVEGRVGEDDDVRRVLAVVVNTEYGRDEGGVFVFATGVSGELRMVATIPITGDFSLSISQNKKDDASSSDESLPPPTSQSIDVTVSVEGGRDRVAIIVSNAQALQDFIAIARSLRELFS
ncbi:hypothetical protein FRB90_009165, partial [Tulasnella sp. 427]